MDEDIVGPKEDFDDDNDEPTILNEIGMGDYRDAIRNLIADARGLV